MANCRWVDRSSDHESRQNQRVTRVHHTHAATAKLFDNAVVGDGLADEGVGLRHSAAILGCDLRQVNESERLHNSEQRQLVRDWSQAVIV